MSAIEEIAEFAVAEIEESAMTPRSRAAFAALTPEAEAEAEILRQNRRAAAVEPESMAAFLDLLSGSDEGYLAGGDYAPRREAPELDWDAVSAALGESQKILIGVQNLLSEILAGMGVEDHAFIRVYRDARGDLRLMAPHPRAEEIETELNGPANADLRDLYEAATAGMGLAGALVGTMRLPEEVLEQVKRRAAFAA